MIVMTVRTTESFSPHKEPANVTGYDHVDESGYAEYTGATLVITTQTTSTEESKRIPVTASGEPSMPGLLRPG